MLWTTVHISEIVTRNVYKTE